ncbi:metallophosphoesterase [Phocaeicola barnesiae]|uniref:metallophosphoesterase n=1 Tax=Phocaeicola barnesiae TaxID=376804 RepID=UPI0012B59F44|nr:metallophosphoesterase [Phocaeicola barnesiae]
MRNLWATWMALCIVLVANAQELHFRDNGTFKIVQFTDTHFCPMKTESDVAIDVIRKTVAAEKPDVLVLTGDVVTGEPAAEGWKRVLSVLDETEIPYILMNGNHDTEQDLSYQEITRLITSANNCLNEVNDKGELSDRILEVKDKQGISTEALIYCLDSHSNSLLSQVGGYAWINYDQIAWYRDQSNRYKAQNGGEPIPALAFFHIPLVEYTEAFNQREGAFSGIRLERECPADINSGMFGAMLEQGDVMGVFTGHDHDNDYVASYKGITLGYGRFSGGKTTYIDLQPGARVITLYEGRKEFTSYIRLQDGRIIDKLNSKARPERDITFAVVADLHFDLLPESDQYYHVRALNNLENNFVWPNGTPCFQGDTLKRLDCVAIAGDIFDKALDETHSLYKERYHQANGEDDKKIKYPVFPGFGNHDIDPVSKKPADNLAGRKMNLAYMDSVLQAKLAKGEILSVDPESRAYSWNIEDVHFVQMHTYAGDDHYCKGNSLEWLENDLRLYAAGGTPVVYIQHYGFDKWAIKWWPKDKREALFDLLDQYNVVGFFVGHTHVPSIESYRGYTIFQVNNAWPDEDGNGSFAVARLKGNTFAVATCRWTDGEGNFEVITPYITPENTVGEWMKRIDGKKRMCKLSIPATHDSGALEGGKLLQTQDVSLEEQLNIGIRGFDIRLKAEDDELRVYHGTARQNITWEKDVLPLFLDFLKKHPSETLVVSVKCEGGSKEEYKRLLSESISNEAYQRYFVDKFRADITLDECRGRIFFVHRDEVMENYPGVYCYGWEDNVTCDMTIRGSNGKEALVSLQDEYQHRYAGKAPYKMATTLKNMMAAMHEEENSNKWFISFASATAFPKDGPKDFSDKVNPGLAHEIQGLYKGFGIVLIDFAGTSDGQELVKRLIGSNFK